MTEKYEEPWTPEMNALIKRMNECASEYRDNSRALVCAIFVPRSLPEGWLPRVAEEARDAMEAAARKAASDQAAETKAGAWKPLPWVEERLREMKSADYEVAITNVNIRAMDGVKLTTTEVMNLNGGTDFVITARSVDKK